LLRPTHNIALADIGLDGDFDIVAQTGAAPTSRSAVENYTIASQCLFLHYRPDVHGRSLLFQPEHFKRMQCTASSTAGDWSPLQNGWRGNQPSLLPSTKIGTSRMKLLHLKSLALILISPPSSASINRIRRMAVQCCPVINLVRRGQSQHHGQPQHQVNIGNVTNSDQLAPLTYTLNGGPSQDLSLADSAAAAHAQRFQCRAVL
jgi:hypothetical protein